MPRRQPISTKQRKAQLQLKRAVKRGDVLPPGALEQSRFQVSLFHGEGSEQSRPVRREGPPKQTSKRLESSFLKVHPQFLETTKMLASVTPLPRPLSPSTVILSESDLVCNSDDNVLRCLKRPKWRTDMTKRQVEMNEEGLFRRWLTETDDRIFRWRSLGESNISRPPESAIDSENPPKNKDNNPHDQAHNNVNAPIYYERNLQVWRQLWRVTEISHILLVLLDSRCPAIHLPPSLQDFLFSLTPPRPLIFVLTKTDMVPESFVSAWATWLRTKYPNTSIVNVRSYHAIHVTDVSSSKSRTKHEPSIRDDDFSQLVLAIQRSYEQLIAPPEKIQCDPQRLKSWETTRNFPTNLRWDQVQLKTAHKESKASDKNLTIGLIGQPNVGKSSLLNAIFGTRRVKASRTPGKTKHLQTLFWTSDIRLVDCPGLVFPNFVRMELQVLSGVLPISQIPSIPACMHYALRLLPLENILRLKHPFNDSARTDTDPYKRTWREGQVIQSKQSILQWTTMDVLTAFAVQKSWVTAKAGRPDINRAGNFILRSLAEGKIKWSFWPPGTEDAFTAGDSGIWLGDALDDLDESWSDTTEDVHTHYSGDDSSTTSDDELLEDPEQTFGRFHALTLDNSQDESL